MRGLLAKGQEPLPVIRQRLVALAPGDGLMVLAPFLPSPLIELLGSEGFHSKVERDGSGDWIVFFWCADL